MIMPTVGRVVWFHPASGDPDLGRFDQSHDGRPMAGIIAHVWSKTSVNLCVIDPNGKTHSRTSVFLHQDGPRPDECFAEWMPFQKGQAAAPAIRDVRYNTKTQKIEVTYVDSPAEDDWVQKVTFKGCGIDEPAIPVPGERPYGIDEAHA
jgi:hypothetical protein